MFGSCPESGRTTGIPKVRVGPRRDMQCYVVLSCLRPADLVLGPEAGVA
jgi:hypothetical protein